MRFPVKLSRAGWIAVGLAFGAVLTPVAASAVTYMAIDGGNGPAVDSTRANQMLTAEAPPSSFAGISDSLTEGCTELPVLSTTRAFIIRQINLVNAGTSVLAYFSDSSSTCKAGIFGYVQTGGTYSDPAGTSLSFNPGVAIPAGGSIWVYVNAAYAQDIQVLGYTVPSSDVTSPTPVTCGTLCVPAPA